MKSGRTGSLQSETGMEDELPDLTELLDAANSTPVKLDAGADAVDTRAKDHDVSCLKGEIMGVAPVGQVQVIRLGRPLGRNCVDLLHHWTDPQFLTQLPNSQLCAEGKGSETQALRAGYWIEVGPQGRDERGKCPRTRVQSLQSSTSRHPPPRPRPHHHL